MTDKTINVSAQNERTHTLSLAAKAGAAVSAIVASLILKAKEVEAGPVAVLNVLRSVFNVKDASGNETDNLSIEFPMLNTTAIPDDENFVKGYNGHCEIYEAPITKNGETKIKRQNFFTTFWNEGTDEGKAQQFVIAQCTMALSATDRAKAEEKYKQMENVQLENLLADTKKAASRGRTYCRKAIGVWHTMVALLGITDTKGAVLVTLEESANGATATSFPYDLVNWEKQGRVFQKMNVTDILKLDVKSARAEGGSLFDALIRQLERDGTGTKAKYPTCENPEMVYDASAAIVNYFDREGEPGIEPTKAMMERFAKKKGGETYIKMLGSLRSILNTLFTKEVEIRHTRILEKDIAEGGETAKAA